MMKFIENSWIGKFVTNISDSFKFKDGGYSARKVGAFVAVNASMYIAAKNADTSNVTELVYAYLVFALLCLSVVTVQQIVEARTGIKSSITTKSSTEIIE